MDEKLIPLNITPYQFEDEDKVYLLQMKGLRFSHKINPKPFAPVFHFHIYSDTTKQNFSDFLDSVPDVFAIEYFKPFQPGISVAGTIVTVQKVDQIYFFSFGSHGQDKSLKTTTSEKLIDELFAYRQFQNFGTISVSRRKIA